jgi:hypothetical protein
MASFVVTRVALDPTVLFDIDRILAAFEADSLRSFASFRELFTSFHGRDLFLTMRAGRRCPPPNETTADYATLLFEALVRRAVEPHSRTFPSRLGAIYMLLLLYELQPTSSPRAQVPILESQWAGIERLAQELRTLRHADGFAALHALWAGGRFSHYAGAHSSVNAVELHAELAAEKKARLLPATLGVGEVGACAYAEHLDEALPRLTELEERYASAMAAAAAARGGGGGDGGDGGGGGDGPDGGDGDGELRAAPPSMAANLASDLREYHAGRLGAAVADERERASVDGGVNLENPSRLRREAVRHRPYEPRHSWTRDGGADRASRRQR